jgi:hypothetical protein
VGRPGQDRPRLAVAVLPVLVAERVSARGGRPSVHAWPAEWGRTTVAGPPPSKPLGEAPRTRPGVPLPEHGTPVVPSPGSERRRRPGERRNLRHADNSTVLRRPNWTRRNDRDVWAPSAPAKRSATSWSVGSSTHSKTLSWAKSPPVSKSTRSATRSSGSGSGTNAHARPCSKSSVSRSFPSCLPRAAFASRYCLT